MVTRQDALVFSTGRSSPQDESVRSADRVGVTVGGEKATTGKMPVGPTAETAVLPLHHFAQGGDASSVLLHHADGDADPFRQVVAFHRAHDDFARKQSTKD